MRVNPPLRRGGDDGTAMDAFTWHNFVRRKDGSPADRYLFQALLVLIVLEVRYSGALQTPLGSSPC